MSLRKVDIPSPEEIALTSEQTRRLDDLLLAISAKMWEFHQERAVEIETETDLASNDPIVLAVASIARKKGWGVHIVELPEGSVSLIFSFCKASETTQV